MRLVTGLVVLALPASFALLNQAAQAQQLNLAPPASSPSSSSSSFGASPSIKSTKQESLPIPGKWYGAVELRHHVSTYYDDDGAYAHQTPSLHARAQLGAQFYDGVVDLYGTFGAYKLAGTQQVLQRRPEVALDLHLVRSDYVTLLQYNVVQLPFEQREPDPDAPDDVLDAGSVYSVGAALTLKAPMHLGSTKLEPQLGFDGWTRLYSRKQYTSEYTEHRDGFDEGRLGLKENGEANQDANHQGEIEDSALHYDQQVMLGFAVTPGILPQSQIELSGNHHSKFAPRYDAYASGADYTYGVDRYSYVRFRISYDINERLSLANDFYDFKAGLFAEERKGEDRRYRNIARITCRL